MNKTDEELNLAEKMAKRYGVRMCDENGDTHGEELYCVGIDDIADIIREALAEQDHFAASGKMIAEQEKQEPVAWPVDRNWFYSVLRYAEKNPDCFDEVAPDCVSLDSCDADTVIDALNAAPVSTEAIRAEALEQAEEIAKTLGGSFSVEFLAAIRELK